MIRTLSLLTVASVALAAGVALAQSDEGHMGAGHMEMVDMPEHMQAMMGVMDGMMQDMPMESSGDPDADFLLMMIPHHQSAIAMARAELEHGDDEATRAMAQAIIDAQEAEIAEMRAMLERLGVEPPAAPAE